ncbi:MAG TPA: DAK2 domain-containing protein [Gaiellaceae bacterium]
MSADAGRLADWLELVLARTEAAQAELDGLDAVAGDGDHGVTMVLGWRTVVAGLKRGGTPGGLLRTGGGDFASVGGSAGPLWGTALLRAGRALGDAPTVALAGAHAAAEAALAGMCERGRCAEGEKSIVDALAPAVRALADAEALGLSAADALRAAAGAAAAGCDATRLMPALRGRASRFPDRAVGHRDPGAASCVIVWEAAADAFA